MVCFAHCNGTEGFPRGYRTHSLYNLNHLCKTWASFALLAYPPYEAKQMPDPTQALDLR